MPQPSLSSTKIQLHYEKFNYFAPHYETGGSRATYSVINGKPVMTAAEYAEISADASMDEIVAQIGPTADIVGQIHPVYNFKAAD